METQNLAGGNLLKKIFSFILIQLFLLGNMAFANDDRIFEINDFSGGLDTKTSQYSLPANKCSIANNLRFNNEYGSFSNREPMLQYGTAGSYAITGLYRYYKSSGDKFLVAAGSTYLKYGTDSTGAFTALKSGLTDGKRWQFVTYQDTLIGMNGYDNAQKWDGETDTTADTDGARSANNLTADLGAPFAELDTGTDLDADSWYQYRVGFYDGTTYYYSTARSNPILTGSSVYNIALTDIPLGPSGTTHRYIYRTVGNASQAAVEADNTFYLVGTIADNTTQTLADDVTDDTADDDAAPAWATVAAGTDYTPPTGKYCELHNERLFIAGNTTNQSDIYWSDEYNPDVFDEVDYEPIRPDDGDVITFLKNQSGYLVVGKENTISKYYTEATSPDDWYPSDPFPAPGCNAPYSAVSTPKGIIYLARKGIYVFNGSYSQLISEVVSPEIDDILATRIDESFGFYFGEEYYLSYTSEESGETKNNRVLVLDLVRNAYATDYRDINCMCLLNSGTDFGYIYCGTSDTDGYVYAFESWQPYLTIKKKSALDLGTFDDTRTTGTELDPEIEIAWDCTINGWLTELQTKDASISTINDVVTYLPDAIIDRPDTDGTWTSPVYNIDALAFDSLEWNESLGTTGNITFNIRAGTTSGACTGASWSSAYTNPNGSDISGETAADYVQLKANLSTTDIDYSPYLVLEDDFVIRLSYTKSGSTYEGNFTSLWRSGFLNFGVGYDKYIESIVVNYEGTTGDLSFGIENDEGTDLTGFDINMSVSPTASDDDYYFGTTNNKYYVYYPPIYEEGENPLIGNYFRFSISNTGTDEFKVKKIRIKYRVEDLTD